MMPHRGASGKVRVEGDSDDEGISTAGAAARR